KVMQDFQINGIAHITGGGITENLPRVLPKNAKLHFAIEQDSWPVLPIFDLVRDLGNVEEAEMYKTFNMGIGMILVVKEADAWKIVKKLIRLGENAHIIGQVRKGKSGVSYI
ncbi:MAG: AIR synthase-related protein, partial [Nitrospirota bacterium]